MPQALEILDLIDLHVSDTRRQTFASAKADFAYDEKLGLYATLTAEAGRLQSRR